MSADGEKIIAVTPKQTAHAASAIKPGDSLPDCTLDFKTGTASLKDYFSNKTGVLFAVPGAFTPVCSEKHVPGFKDKAAEIKKRVDFLGCIAVNDAFVLKAWAKSAGIENEFSFISDPIGVLVQSLGVSQDLSDKGLGLRSRRLAMVVAKGKVHWIGFDDDAFAEKVIEHLDCK